MIYIKAPESPQEWEQYYDLRFTVLREPWGQPKGSEVLKDEHQVIHAMAVEQATGKVLGVARLQQNSEEEGQVRCVAVSKDAQGKGVGKVLMQYLENAALQKGISYIVLDARENALPFYKAIGYSIVSESYLLFGQIQHWKMQKSLS
jgi:N-acetylglutamate synthase-like GNAT family acetyltransferase